VLIIAKTKIEVDTSWISQLNFKAHDDYDLAGNVDAVSIKSNDGGIHSFYRDKPVEHPSDFRYTKYYSLCKPLLECFEFETTRIRIHKQEPGQTIPVHTDDNNINAKTNDDFRLRAVTALSESEDFIYQFNLEGIIEQFSLKKGETVLFDPDLVGHGMVNQSKTKTRYSLVQIFKAYPVSPWLKDFINTEQTVIV
tara:strand:+ start:96 stop:680 length:585 start_codon:yes stop_codon:yes gene_type:complete